MKIEGYAKGHKGKPIPPDDEENPPHYDDRTFAHRNEHWGKPKAQPIPYVPLTERLGTWNCWCGQPQGHDWPGRDRGEPHPR